MRIRVTDTGDLVMEDQSSGSVTEQFVGKGDYEYYVTVTSQHKDALLSQLLRDRFLEDGTPTSSFMAYLKEKGIPYDFDSW